MSREELRRAAIEHGLPNLDEKQLDEFARGLEAKRKLAAKLPNDLHWTEEPALTLSLVGKGGRR